MEKKNLWNDAAKYGAIMGMVSILFGVIANFVQGWWLSLLSLAVFITLLFLFTRRRVRLYGDGPTGYGYGQCLKYIFLMILFAGILDGAYQIVAVNWLFAAHYDEVLNTTIATLASSGLYTDEQLDLVIGMTRNLMHSPLYLVFSSVLGAVIKGVFFGLIVSAYAKRDPNMFSGNGPEQDNVNPLA